LMKNGVLVCLTTKINSKLHRASHTVALML
jgi:hypothetical protein